MKGLLTAAVMAWLLGSCVPSRADEAVPCDANRARTAADAGWRVQVDPDTGVYSLPTATAATTSTASSARTASGPVVQPGTTAAGGWKIELDGAAATREQQ